MILDGYDSELDEFRKIKGGGKELLAEYLEEIKVQTGIPTVKLGNNRILGHYLEGDQNP